MPYLLNIGKTPTVTEELQEMTPTQRKYCISTLDNKQRGDVIHNLLEILDIVPEVIDEIATQRHKEWRDLYTSANSLRTTIITHVNL